MGTSAQTKVLSVCAINAADGIFNTIRSSRLVVGVGPHGSGTGRSSRGHLGGVGGEGSNHERGTEAGGVPALQVKKGEERRRQAKTGEDRRRQVKNKDTVKGQNGDVQCELLSVSGG